MQLIGVFANPRVMAANDLPEHCRYSLSCPHFRRTGIVVGAASLIN
jgi:hypothetical protein